MSVVRCVVYLSKRQMTTSCWTVGGHRPPLQLDIGETERILISPEAYDRIPDFACSLDNGTDILG